MHMPDIVEEAFRVIQSHSDGVPQSELWKLLNIDSRKCSRVVKKLLDADLIDRLDYKNEGAKTYLLKAKKRPINPSLLIAGDMLIPCIGCDEECMARECPYLTDWLYQLAIDEYNK